MPYANEWGGSATTRLHILVSILAIAFCVTVASQTVALIRDRDALRAQHAAQESTFQEALKLRQQLVGLAGRTAQLAKEGDANAAAIVERLRQQGITINLPADAK